MSTLEKAISLAVKAHAGQKDKADQPYILHCIRVMLNTDTEEEMIAAVLHDVMEDIGYAPQHLLDEGFPENIVDALICLTHLEDETYEEYILKVSANPIARNVKIADLKDNMNIKRIKNPTEKDYKRLEKYKKALNFLLEKNI